MRFPEKFEQRPAGATAVLTIMFVLCFQLLFGQRASYANQTWTLPDGSVVTATVVYVDKYRDSTDYGWVTEDRNTISISASATYQGLNLEQSEAASLDTIATETLELTAPPIAGRPITPFATTLILDANGAVVTTVDTAASSAQSSGTESTLTTVSGNTGSGKNGSTSYGPPNPPDKALPINITFAGVGVTLPFSAECTASAVSPKRKAKLRPTTEGTSEPAASAQAYGSAIIPGGN